MSSYTASVSKHDVAQCVKSLIRVIFKCHDPRHLRLIHSKIPLNILQQNVYLNIALMKQYAHHSSIHDVTRTFQSISTSMSVTDHKIIKIMMRTLIQNGQYQKALAIYDEYIADHIGVHILALKACTKSMDMDRGTAIIHSKIQTNPKWNGYLPLKTALIEFHGINKDVESALNVFHSVAPQQMNAYLVSAMMKALIQNNRFSESLKLYDRYDRLHDDVCHLLAIKASRCCSDYEKGHSICIAVNVQESKHGLELSNVLIEFYGHFGRMEKVHEIFHKLPKKWKNHRNPTILSTMMKVLNVNKEYHHVLALYDEYHHHQHSGNSTLCVDSLRIQALKACIHLDDKQHGEYIIGDTIMLNVWNIRLKVVMMEFYGHFRDVNAVQKVFHSIAMDQHSAVSISTAMKALIDNGHSMEALRIYNAFNGNTTLMDDICHNVAITASMQSDDFESGKQIHRNIDRNDDDRKCDLKKPNVVLQNALISFYGHFRDLHAAKEIFDRIEDDRKDIVTFSSMMNVYCAMALYQECLALFRSMELQPDVVTYGIVLNACTQSTAYHFGRKIHLELRERDNGKMMGQIAIQIQLIRMYSKCGDLQSAQQIFERSEHRRHRVEIWNAMINGFGRNGHIDRVKEMYVAMQEMDRLQSDGDTFRILLSACSHSGDVEWARFLWKREMSEDMKRDVSVVNAFVDCLCRRGLTNEARSVILENNPNDEIPWTSLLTAYLSEIKCNRSSLCVHDVEHIYESLKSFGDDADVLRLYGKLLSAVSA